MDMNLLIFKFKLIMDSSFFFFASMDMNLSIFKFKLIMNTYKIYAYSKFKWS
jgi:hypothetical protein